MEKILMKKDNMVHYVPCESVKDFLDFGWQEVDLEGTSKTETEKVQGTTTKATTKRKARKSN